MNTFRDIVVLDLLVLKLGAQMLPLLWVLVSIHLALDQYLRAMGGGGGEGTVGA